MNLAWTVLKMDLGKNKAPARWKLRPVEIPHHEAPKFSEHCHNSALQFSTTLIKIFCLHS